MDLLEFYRMCKEQIVITEDLDAHPLMREYSYFNLSSEHKDLRNRQVDCFKIWKMAGRCVIAVQLKEEGKE